MKEVVLSHSTISYEAPIVYITFSANVELGFVEVRDLIAAAEQVSGGMPYFVLSDIRDGISVTPQGKKTSADPKSAPLHKGTAILVRNAMMQAAANFFDKVNPAPYPFRAFTEKQEAIDWLMSLSLEKSAS